MRLRQLLAAAALLLLAAGCALSHHSAAPAPLPVLPHLPTTAPTGSVADFRCPRDPGTTIGIESCDARLELQLNARFNRAVDALWPLLDHTSRREFVSGQRAWNRYVSGECDVQSREFLGGSERPVAASDCEDALTATRVRDIEGTLAEYCQGRVRTGAARRCPRP